MRNRLTQLTALWALFAFLAGCGGSDGPGDGDPAHAVRSGVATIGAGGGVLSGEDGAQVTFPAKALAADVTVRIAKDSTGAPPLPAAAMPAGAVYTITPHGGALDVHAEVSIPVERTEIAPHEQLLLITARPGDAQWTVLSGATYSNGALRAPVMHFSFFQAIVLSDLYMPSLVTTLARRSGTINGSVVLQKFNNVGGVNIGSFAPDFEFDRATWMQSAPVHLEAKLTYPAAPSTAVRVGVTSRPPARVCLPSSYGHGGAVWRFLRNGSETLSPDVGHLPIREVSESIYPRFEGEIYYDGLSRLFGDDYAPGFGALHIYGQDAPRRGAYTPAASSDVWALPPAGNLSDDDQLMWRGVLTFVAEQHNGRMRIDVTVATDCNLLLEAVPLALGLNLDSRLPSFAPYNGVLGVASPISVPSGDTAVLPFEEEVDNSSLSIAWEYSRDVVNWQKLPVPAQYIRDDGRSTFQDRYLEGHRYSIVIPNVQPSQAGWYRAWACSRPQPADGSAPALPSVCLSRTPVQLVVLTEPPAVLTQPVAQIVQAGETASFFVRVAGVLDVDVQWQKRPLAEAAFGIGSWTSIAGATDTVYTTPPVTLNDTGTLYRAVLSTSLGSTPTDAALLTVVEQLAPPVVQSQPGNSNTVIGGTAVFVATVSGTAPLSYQWRRNGINITGANSPVLTLTNVSAASDARYDLVISNRAGTATTEAATLLVTPAAPAALPPTIAAAPASLTVAAGQAANFAVAVNGTGPYTYSWQKDGSSVPIPGADAASFSIPSATMADAGTYSVRVTNTVGTVLSAAATLTVTPASGTPAAPTITTAPVGLAVLPGAGATFAAAVTGTAPFRYQWRRNGTDIAGATGPVLHIAMVTALDAGQYALEVANAAGAASSTAVPLIVIGAPAISAQPATATAVEGTTARFDVTASGDGVRYQWTRNQVAIAGATSASYTTPIVAVADDGALYSVIVYNGAGVAISQAALLTVSAGPAVLATTLASVSSAGTLGDNTSARPALSADGRLLAFTSYATNLVPGVSGAPTESGHAYVRNLSTGVTSLVNQTPAGMPSSRGVGEMTLAAGGRHVVFTSLAGDLVAGDTNGSMDLFVRDLQSGVTTRINLLPGGSQITDAGNGMFHFGASISADGRWVAFADARNLLDAGQPLPTSAVYLRDVQASATRLVASSPTYRVGQPIISNDASRIVFVHALPSQHVLSSYDVQTGNTLTLFTHDTSVFPEGIGAGMSLSDNGRFLAFTIRSAAWIPGAAAAFNQVVVLDHTNPGVLTIASTGLNGIGNGHSAYPVLSGDGRFVLFSTHSPSLSSDPAATIRPYLMVRDLVGQTTQVASRRPNGTNVWTALQGQSLGMHALSADGAVLALVADRFDMTGEAGGVQVYVAPRP
jgi:hypothetical protein